MIADHHIPSAASPAAWQYLPTANRERASVFRAARRWAIRALGTLIDGLAGPIRRAWRANQTYRALNALSDHQLRDIGLTRSEIVSVSETVANAGAGTRLTIADLRRARFGGDSTGVAWVTTLPREDRRQRQPALSASRRNATSIAPQDELAG